MIFLFNFSFASITLLKFINLEFKNIEIKQKISKQIYVSCKLINH
jgi:hypothetical protein